MSIAQVQKQKVEQKNLSLQIVKIVQTVWQTVLSRKWSKRYRKTLLQKAKTILTFRKGESKFHLLLLTKKIAGFYYLLQENKKFKNQRTTKK